MYADLRKFIGEEEMDAKSKFWLVCAISSEQTDIHQALRDLQAECYLVPTDDAFNALSC